jgi:radical SAM superfamily enzyme YgiQ (UPF0313 family)
MKVLFVSPGWSRGRLWGELGFKFPSLSLAALAGATPAGWETALIDENIEPLDFSTEADIVAITAMTPQAPRAYEIAAGFRARGKTVVMGGFHASNLPDEALSHVDTVVVGEGDLIWPRLLDDFSKNQLLRRYHSEQLLDMATISEARREIFSGKRYLLTNTLQTTRGCPFDCEFCSVTAFYGRKYRERPVEQVLSELERLRKKNSFAFFVDDNLVADRTHRFCRRPRAYSGRGGVGLCRHVCRF